MTPFAIGYIIGYCASLGLLLFLLITIGKFVYWRFLQGVDCTFPEILQSPTSWVPPVLVASVLMVLMILIGGTQKSSRTSSSGPSFSADEYVRGCVEGLVSVVGDKAAREICACSAREMQFRFSAKQIHEAKQYTARTGRVRPEQTEIMQECASSLGY